jgi:hypothetical protein
MHPAACERGRHGGVQGPHRLRIVTAEWIDVQPHAALEFSALGCPNSSQIA